MWEKVGEKKARNCGNDPEKGVLLLCSSFVLLNHFIISQQTLSVWRWTVLKSSQQSQKRNVFVLKIYMEIYATGE